MPCVCHTNQTQKLYFVLQRCKKYISSAICSGNSTRQSILFGYVELDDGWISPLNGYQYKVIHTRQTWNESQSICQSWGGDIIVHGFRDHAACV